MKAVSVAVTEPCSSGIQKERGSSPRTALNNGRSVSSSVLIAANLRMLYGGWKAERDEKLAAKAAAAEEKAKAKKGKGGKGKGK